MKLIVGLGNPGPQYLFTRHNIGFMVLDALHDNSAWKTEHQAHTSKIQIQNQPSLLVKPQTFMNLSGNSVSSIMNYYKISKESLLVIHDDKDIPFLNMKFQKNRGAGGHNGVQNIHDCLGHSDYYRLKLGVASSSNPPQSTSSFVLAPFSDEEKKPLKDFIIKSAEAVQYFILHGGEKAGNIYNQKPVG